MAKGRAFIGDDGDREWLCKHGVGHGFNVHTCDGEKCCKEALSHLKPKMYINVHKNVEKRTEVSMKTYNTICDRIIAMGLPVHETLIKLLEEAGKYTIIKHTALSQKKKRLRKRA